ncbi:NfeD family protein [uncultured Cohaesibacter sp.]|uniref:NfeD family protein n=1 Tax=uncultured Cohaesibacter sp. TaxID=1002546 RepID=UPI0029C6A2AF|nr:NfeD family protein [uncultured Cohaesibacter sp.]
MIQSYFVDLGPWAWLILGLVLLVLELVAPGTMFLWFGIAALIVGGVSFVVDLGWQNAFILFAVLSLISVIIGRVVVSRMAKTTTDKPLLNERTLALIGQTFYLDQPIEHGQGRLKVRDSYWRVTGPDCPAGSEVEVIGGEGTMLKVRPVDPASA